MRRQTSCLYLFLFSLFFCGVAAASPGIYRLGPEDLLKIHVFRVAELSQTVRVDARGNISLPLIGPVRAEGRTAAELEQEVATRLGERYLQDPYVSVFVEEYASQRVTVEGAVNKPGIFALKGRTTLLQAIALAEGLAQLADAEQVKVFRKNGDGARRELVFDIDAIRQGQADDPPVFKEDVVVVPRAAGRSAVKGVADTLRGFIGFGRFPY